MQRILAGCCLLLGLMVCSAGLARAAEEESAPALYVDLSACVFDECTVEEGTVRYRCRVAVHNHTGEDQSFALYASDWINVTGGLLSDAAMTGRNPGSGENLFTVSPCQVQPQTGQCRPRLVSVDFYGSQGEGTEKANRYPPEEIRLSQ